MSLGRGGVVPAGTGAMLCAVRVAGQQFAIRTSAIREVIGSASLVKVPLGPPELAGIMHHRGAMLATLSLTAVLRLELAPAAPAGCVVVMRAESAGGESYGLLVDELAGVLTLDAAASASVPPTLAEDRQHLFSGMFVHDGGVMVELDPEQLGSERLLASAQEIF